MTHTTAVHTQVPHAAGPRPVHAGEAGFSILETLVSMLLLAGVMMGLGQVFLLGMSHASTSSANLIAREKAREAIESVHTARDTRTITWNQIRNETARMCPGVAQPPDWNNDGGTFIDGAQEGIRIAGPDGLVNTPGDEALPLERVVHLGPDGIRGTADDWEEELRQYDREIWICDHTNSLREVRVTIDYRVGNITRQYQLTTFISNYS